MNWRRRFRDILRKYVNGTVRDRPSKSLLINRVIMTWAKLLNAGPSIAMFPLQDGMLLWAFDY